MLPLRRLMMFNQNISLPFGYRQSCSEKGVRLDGVELAVADPAPARIALLQAGLTEELPSKWLAAHRELEHDVAEIEVIRADVAHARRFGRVDGVLSGVGLVSLFAAKATHHFELAIAGSWPSGPSSSCPSSPGWYVGCARPALKSPPASDGR